MDKSVDMATTSSVCESIESVAVDVENEILQFLLGKVPSIRSSPTNRSPKCTTPTTPGGNKNAGTKSETKGALEEVMIVPELEPISETDSDDEVSDNQSVSKHKDARPQDEDVDPPQKFQHMNESTCTLKPDTQPEEEESSIIADNGAALRQRRAQGDPPSVNSSCQAPCQRPLPSQLSVLRTLSSHSDLLYILLVLSILIGYCIGIIYRAFHPISYPLPNVDGLFKPYDISNVSVHFSLPQDSGAFTEAVMIEWEITNFPVDALRKFGPEPFEYRLFLDDKQLLFDVGFWSIKCENDTELNTTMHYRLRPRDIPSFGLHTLRLEVMFAIPGSDDELFALSDRTTFTFAARDTSAPYLEITSPLNGGLIQSRSFVLQYEAHNLHHLDVVVDKMWRMHKHHLSDGNLLLRRLAAGSHSILLEGFDPENRKIAAKEIHVEVDAT